MAGLDAALSKWWVGIRKLELKAGTVIPLPHEGTRATVFHPSCERLYIRECFDGLFKRIQSILTAEEYSLVRLNGNSGVGKSAFLWYFIVRMGVMNPNMVLVFEYPPCVWEFRGAEVSIFYGPDMCNAKILAADFHLIDQKYVGRLIGKRALLAASPDENNWKEARKLRTMYLLYMPVWGKGEFMNLVEYRRRRAEQMEGEQRALAMARLAVADKLYEWFGGIPSRLWDTPVDELGQSYRRDVLVSLANTKLKNVRAILLEGATSKGVSWKLFHFNVSGDFSSFKITFCSDKVASLYAEHLSSLKVDKIRSFLEASQNFPEYSSLRGFVFEQYVIGQALHSTIFCVPPVDNVYCNVCQNQNDRGRGPVNWIECCGCGSWYHMKCVRVKKTGNNRSFTCKSCRGRPASELVSDGKLLLRYYDGSLLDALRSAGKDAVKYLWRPLRKNNAVFDFVLPPRTLGQVSVSLRHPPLLNHLKDAVAALRTWRSEYCPEGSDDKDYILLFLIPPENFVKFSFQRYRTSARKVSLRSLKGVVQCKVAVPVNGSAFAMVASPGGMESASVDLDGSLESWEGALECVEATQDWSSLDGDERSLEFEKHFFTERGVVYKEEETEVEEDAMIWEP